MRTQTRDGLENVFQLVFDKYVVFFGVRKGLANWGDQVVGLGPGLLFRDVDTWAKSRRIAASTASERWMCFKFQILKPSKAAAGRTMANSSVSKVRVRSVNRHFFQTFLRLAYSLDSPHT